MHLSEIHLLVVRDLIGFANTVGVLCLPVAAKLTIRSAAGRDGARSEYRRSLYNPHVREVSPTMHTVRAPQTLESGGMFKTNQRNSHASSSNVARRSCSDLNKSA